MVQDLWNVPAVWGFGGAFIFAGPKFVACYANAKLTKGPWSVCFFDLIVCLVIGTFAAAAFAEWLHAFLKLTGPPELRVLATVVGMIANPCAPGVTKLLTGQVLSRLPKGEEK